MCMAHINLSAVENMTVFCSIRKMAKMLSALMPVFTSSTSSNSCVSIRPLRLFSLTHFCRRITNNSAGILMFMQLLSRQRVYDDFGTSAIVVELDCLPRDNLLVVANDDACERIADSTFQFV